MNASPGRDEFDSEYEAFDADDEATEDDLDDEDDDLDDEDDDEEEDDDEDDLDDADDDDIDFVIAAYAEDGVGTATALDKELANDLDALIEELRRRPGDAGVLGFVALVDEMFVLVRVRGAQVQVVLSDGSMASEWPIARDVADFLGVDEPDEDEVDPIGDLDILADRGVAEATLSRLCDDVEDNGVEDVLGELTDLIGLGAAFRPVAEAQLAD